MKKLFKTVIFASITASLAFTGQAVYAQSNQAITFVVPYSPGGASDQITRVVAERTSRELGRNIIVENKPGSAGIVAAQYVLKAKPDGNTFLVGSNAPLVINEAVYDKLSYSPKDDFLPVAGLGKTPLVLVANPENPASDVLALADWAKNQAKPVSMGSGGNGNITHLAGIYAAKTLGFDVNHIPFQGTAPGVVSLIGGNIDMMFDTLPSSLTQIQGGRLKAYAMLDETRWPTLPDVPTLVEMGYPSLVASAWFGLVAPKGTPEELIMDMNKAINAAHADPSVQEKLAKLGAKPMPGSAEDFGIFIQSERDQWLPVVKETGVKAD